METIKVNMNPNPLDVQTIHASQNDGEARQWGFELHNNGDVIDASEISDQLVFKAYKGGTEQILPENGSVPTTSPIIADIKYPHGEMTDQEFLYRESPTEEDGLAKITDIKGNTLVWNQLFEPRDNGSFSFNGVTVTVQDGKYTLSGTATSSGGRWARWNKSNIVFKKGHKYLYSIFVAMIYSYSSSGDFAGELSAGQRIFEPTEDMTVFLGFNAANGTTYNQSGYIYIIDLTAMGLDSLTEDDFTSLFPLSYYSYNQGSLLSFNGNGIKTVGKNLFNKENVTNGGFFAQDGTINSNPSYAYSDYISIIPNQKIVISGVTGGGAYTCFYDENKNLISSSQNQHAFPYTYDAKASYVRVSVRLTELNSCQIEIGTSATSYEPYTSSTLSLPISTYFPTGMKSAGSVYDELTNSKAIARIGEVDLGSLTWALNDATNHIFEATITDMKPMANYLNNLNFASSMYAPSVLGKANMPNLSVRQASNNSNHIFLKNTSYSDATAFKSAMSGVYLYYELATPTETSFTTASLVTENAEIPLSNEDGDLIGKCTEQLSENPGFFDAKIKLTDADGECYSNKLQLHVERSPQ